MKIKFGWGLLGILVLSVGACSSSNQVSNAKNTSSSQWYKQAKSFTVAQGSYSAVATSLSADSTIALYKADQTALANLRSGMQGQLEQLRRKLVSQNVTSAGKPEFIMLVRGAIPDKMSRADRARSLVVSKNGLYQAYVEFSYSKTDLSNDLLNALSANTNYSSAVKNAPAFKSWTSPQAADSTKSTK